MSFDPIASPVNVVYITKRGGTPTPTPGIARVTGADLKFRFDVQAGAGTTGFPQVYHGADLVEFDIVIELWTSELFAAWETFRPIVQIPPQARAPKPLQMSHPQLVQQGVSQAVVLKVGQVEVDEYMKGTVRIACRQYKQSTQTLSKPSADPTEPLDPYDQIIAANRKTLQDQADQLAK